MNMRRFAPTLSLALVLVATAAYGASHPEASLRSPRSSAAAGTAIPLVGEKFQEAQTVKLVLRGALAEYPLGEATADDGGRFTMQPAIPAGVRPGLYRIEAVADDGDAVAKVDLTVEAAEATDGHAVPGGGATHGSMEESASMDALPIQRSWSGAEWGVIGVLIGLAAGMGARLIRRSA